MVTPLQQICSLNQCTREKADIKITSAYGMLHEPTTLPSPQMKRIESYYEGKHCKEAKDEFKIMYQISKHLVSAGDAITEDEFLHAVADGSSKRIALVGRAGVGKTTELKKLAQKLLDRKSDIKNDVNQEYIVHFIDLKSMRNKQSVTLQDFLFEDDFEKKADREFLLKWVAENQTGVVFLIDNLELANWKTSLVYKNISWQEEASTGTLMYNLLTGNIFPNVKIVLASRESALFTLPLHARPELIVALNGFKMEDAKSLLDELIAEADDRGLNNIENLDSFTPVYIIFAALLYKSCADAKDRFPKYRTEFLAKILEVFTTDAETQETNIDILCKMMSMAYEGLKDKQTVFKESDLSKHGLTFKDVSDITSEVPKGNIHPGILMKGHMVKTFCYQILQEFLAACHISKMSFSYYEIFIEHQARRDREHWLVVLQFLCGITMNSHVKFDERLAQS